MHRVQFQANAGAVQRVLPLFLAGVADRLAEIDFRIGRAEGYRLGVGLDGVLVTVKLLQDIADFEVVFRVVGIHADRVVVMLQRFFQTAHLGVDLRRVEL